MLYSGNIIFDRKMQVRGKSFAFNNMLFVIIVTVNGEHLAESVSDGC